jgi:hypothetical protein
MGEIMPSRPCALDLQQRPTSQIRGHHRVGLGFSASYLAPFHPPSTVHPTVHDKLTETEQT